MGDYCSERGPDEEARKALYLTHLAGGDGDSSRLFIGGFSQGCQMAWDIALTWWQQPGGLLAFCGFPLWCSVAEAQESTLLAGRSSLAILACHGAEDQVVSPDLAVEKFLPLADCGCRWEFIVYDDLSHHVLHDQRLVEQLCRFLWQRWNVTQQS